MTPEETQQMIASCSAQLSKHCQDLHLALMTRINTDVVCSPPDEWLVIRKSDYSKIYEVLDFDYPEPLIFELRMKLLKILDNWVYTKSTIDQKDIEIKSCELDKLNADLKATIGVINKITRKTSLIPTRRVRYIEQVLDCMGWGRGDGE